MRRVARLVPVAVLFGLMLAWQAEAASGLPGKRKPSPPRITVRQNASVVGQWEKLELTIALPRTYENPFDPAQIRVIGEFQPPSGRAVRVPGFYYRGYLRSRDGSGNEVLAAGGTGVFKVRFAWGAVGEYGYQVMVQDGSGTRAVGRGRFSVTAGSRKGPVRRSTAPFYFRFDSGPPYFPIGENMCWPGGAGTYDYDLWMNQLAGRGGNYLRLWVVNEWNKLGLEHLSVSPGDGNGLGRYDQQAAWRIDYILDLAEQLGLRVLICIDSFNSLDANGIYGNWNRYPYNAANGGPCAQPWDFFTNLQAQRLFQQRLRYLAARWGYSASVFAWEFWNEVDLVTGYDSPAVASWHQQMARNLRRVDPWAHLITTSYGDTNGDPAVDGLAEMDFVQSHNYGSKDIAGMVNAFSLQKTARYGKPHYFGEFGADVNGNGDTTDPEGIHLHNGLWSAMLSRCAGTAMLWWWDNYVEPNHLYDLFAPVAAYAAGVDWVSENYAPGEVVGLRYAPGHEPGTYAALPIDPPGESWSDGSPYNEPHTCQVGNDGSVTNYDVLSRVEHGLVNHLNWHNPVTFLVNYPVQGTFEVGISAVSGYGGARLVVSLDGTPARTDDFPDTLPNNYDTMHQYDGIYAIDVPAGSHTIVVENTGTDWFYVSYRLTNYLTAPNLRVLVLSNSTSGLVWVQNKDHTWWNHANGIPPQPVNASEITLGGFTPGNYQIEQWDTYSGVVTQTSPYTSTDGTILITTPSGLTTDLAYKIKGP